MDRMQHRASSHTRSARDATSWWFTARGREVVLVVATLLLVASLARLGYLLAPSAVERALIRTVAQATGSVLTVGEVRVDPMRLGIVLDDVQLADADSGQVLTVQRVEYRLRGRSLLGARRVVDGLALERPQMTLTAAGQTGTAPGASLPMRLLSALIDSESFQIERLSIADGEIRLHHDAEGIAHVRELTGIALTLGSLDSGVAAAPAPYHLEIDEAYGVRLTLQGEVQLRAATVGAPAVQVLPSRGEVSGLRLPVLPGVLLIAPVVEIDALVGTLDPPDARSEVAARVHIAQALLREGDGAELSLSQLEGAIDLDTNAQGGTELQLKLQGRSAIADRLELSGRYLSADTLPTVALTLRDVAGEPLSQMIEAVLGRRLDAGRATIGLQADSDAQGRLSKAVLEVVASDLDFAPETPAASPEPGVDVALLLALLEDTRGQISLTIPVETTAATTMSLAVTQALRRYAFESVGSPVAALGRSLALPAPPSTVVRFEPGAAALTQAATEALSELAGALLLRPRLSVAVPVNIDPQLDRDALAHQQIELHVTLATAGAEFRARPRPVDFASPRAQDVLDEFAGERLPATELAAIAAQYGRTGDSRARAPYYRAVFAALVDSEPIERGALERIGRFRARSIADALTGLGLSPTIVELGENVTAVSSSSGHATVPVELDLRANSRQQN